MNMLADINPAIWVAFFTLLSSGVTAYFLNKSTAKKAVLDAQLSREKLASEARATTEAAAASIRKANDDTADRLIQRYEQAISVLTKDADRRAAEMAADANRRTAEMTTEIERMARRIKEMEVAQSAMNAKLERIDRHVAAHNLGESRRKGGRVIPWPINGTSVV